MKEKYFVVANTISKWKIDNFFERKLSYLADKSEFGKLLYVLFYKICSYKYYAKGVELANVEINRQLDSLDSNIKTCLKKKKLVRDMIYSLHRFGTSFEEYFVFKFYERNLVGRICFNNLKRQYGYCQLVNQPNIRSLFDDKGALYKKLKPYYKRDVVVVYDEFQKTDLEGFLKKHASFIFKPLKGHSGQGIKIYHNYKLDNSFFSEFFSHGAFVVEELIEQADEMAIIHEESINTVRIVTFKINDDVHLVGAALRMGVGASVVDNAGAGGIYASIDTEHGFVNSMACDNLNHHYSLHPTSNCKIVGFDLPQWNEAIAMVKEMAKLCGGATVIAWDLAYSKNGWLVIEGNDVGEPYLLQAPLQVGVQSTYIKLLDLYFQTSK